MYINMYLFFTGVLMYLHIVFMNVNEFTDALHNAFFHTVIYISY